ncbi:MAG: hypothetical protein QXU62_05615, partial [Thermofilaceae archaeon]
MKGWQVKLCSLLLILILLTPEIPWREAGAQPAADEERYYRCRAEKCLTYQPTGSMPNNIPYQAVQVVGSHRFFVYGLTGVEYDRYGRPIYFVFDKLYAPGLVYQAQFFTCMNVAQAVRNFLEAHEVKSIAVIDTPGPNTTHVGVGGQLRNGFLITSHPSTSGPWSRDSVQARKVPGLDKATYTYWVESDKSSTFFWLSTLGIWAVKTDGSVLWKREENEFRRSGKLVYGGGKLLYYTGETVYILDARTGELLNSYSIETVRARYSPSNDAFIVVAANGTVYRIASP